MSTNNCITSDGAGPMDSQSYVQSDWECASGHSKLQHNGESTLSVGSCWPYPAGREAVPRVAPPLGGRLGVQHRAVQSKFTHTMTLHSDMFRHVPDMFPARLDARCGRQSRLNLR